MPEVVIVNGPPGVGKTTVSRILADIVPGTVCIHGDDLRAFAAGRAPVTAGPVSRTIVFGAGRGAGSPPENRFV